MNDGSRDPLTDKSIELISHEALQKEYLGLILSNSNTFRTFAYIVAQDMYNLKRISASSVTVSQNNWITSSEIMLENMAFISDFSQKFSSDRLEASEATITPIVHKLYDALHSNGVIVNCDVSLNGTILPTGTSLNILCEVCATVISLIYNIREFEAISASNFDIDLMAHTDPIHTSLYPLEARVYSRNESHGYIYEILACISTVSSKLNIEISKQMITAS